MYIKSLIRWTFNTDLHIDIGRSSLVSILCYWSVRPKFTARLFISAAHSSQKETILTSMIYTLPLLKWLYLNFFFYFFLCISHLYLCLANKLQYSLGLGQNIFFLTYVMCRIRKAPWHNTVRTNGVAVLHYFQISNGHARTVI